MNNLFLALYVKLQSLTNREDGQDLVEYALLVCLIALAAITGVNKVASAVTTVFSNIRAARKRKKSRSWSAASPSAKKQLLASSF